VGSGAPGLRPGGEARLVCPPPPLLGGVAHVWCVDLAPGQFCTHALAETLARDEHERAAKFQFSEHREQFIVARGALRLLLGGYLGVESRSVVFEYGSRGKPCLAWPADDDLHFNVAHSAGLALCGFARTNIGVDIEESRPFPDLDEIVQTFAEDEIRALSALPPERRRKAFFACWTRKEAYLKARGVGLSIPLDSFSVSVGPEETPIVLRRDSRARDDLDWSLNTLDVGSRHAAALATFGPQPAISQWSLALAC
jgi:4'-phosphopantetheinyl transferase